MIRSRVFTYGFRLFFGLGAAAMVAAVVFALGSSFDVTDEGWMDRVLGPVTLGWKGGVGSHLGYVTLLATALLAGTVGTMLVALRDADAEAQAQVLEVDKAPVAELPSGFCGAPFLGGVVTLVGIVGLVLNPMVSVGAMVAGLAVAVIWTVRG